MEQEAIPEQKPKRGIYRDRENDLFLQAGRVLVS